MIDDIFYEGFIKRHKWFNLDLSNIGYLLSEIKKYIFINETEETAILLLNKEKIANG